MVTHAQYLAWKKLGSLDGLRAISIMVVIWHHTIPAWNLALDQISRHGVTVFFVISGFLITSLLLRERDKRGSIDLKGFYLRRTLRIFPLYYTVLALYVAIVALAEPSAAERSEFFGNLPYFATYTTNLFVDLRGRVIFYFAWSLATQEQFYLIWPPLLWLAGSLPRACLILVPVFVASVFGELLHIPVLEGLPVAIVCGSLLAVALHGRIGFALLQPLLGWPWSTLIWVAVLLAVLVRGPQPDFVIGLLATAVVGSCVLSNGQAAGAVLAWRPLAYVGSISYGIYLLHMLCKNVVVKLLAATQLPADGLLAYGLTVAAAVTAAALSFRYFESYFIELGKKRRLRPASHVPA